MCDSCNCGGSGPATIVFPGERRHDHNHGHYHHHHDHHHDHDHAAEETLRIKIEQNILGANNELAVANRAWLQEKGITALNLVSSPGSGKTTLLEQTLSILKQERSVAVIEGDQQTTRDAERIDAIGVKAVQINTGAGCHLDAAMVRRAFDALAMPDNTLLFIENVGNLVCPALFDLGEKAKVVILSVTEGADKPQKYPAVFHAAATCVINKIDLLPYVDFEVEACRRHAAEINPHLRFFELSARTGAGMAEWLEWLRKM